MAGTCLGADLGDYDERGPTSHSFPAARGQSKGHYSAVAKASCVESHLQ